MIADTSARRAVRGGLLVVACVLLAFACHLCGGGHLPLLPESLIIGALVSVMFAVLADRQRGFPQLLAGSLGAQFLLHEAFLLSAPGTAVSTSARQLCLHALASVAVALLARHADSLLQSLRGLLCRRPLPERLVVAVPAVAATPRQPVLPDVPELRLFLGARVYPDRGPPPGCHLL